MIGAFTSWSNVYEEAWKHLNPGGWIEVMDFDDNATILEFFKGEKVIQKWYDTFVSSLAKSGRPAGADHLEEELLLQLGFVEVESSVTDLKMGAWGEDRGLSGTLLNLMMGAVEAITLRPFVEFGGYELGDVEKICEEVREIAMRVAGRPQTAEGCTFKVKVLRGRKPEVVVPKDTKGSANGHLKPGVKDTDGESMATIKAKTNGHHA